VLVVFVGTSKKRLFLGSVPIFFSENIDSALILQEKLATKLVLFTGFSGFHDNYGGPSRFDHSRPLPIAEEKQ